MDTDKEVNLKQFKGHHRKFPWTLIIRILTAGALVGLSFYLIAVVNEAKNKNQENRNDPNEIEILIEP